MVDRVFGREAGIFERRPGNLVVMGDRERQCTGYRIELGCQIHK